MTVVRILCMVPMLLGIGLDHFQTDVIFVFDPGELALEEVCLVRHSDIEAGTHERVSGMTVVVMMLVMRSTVSER